MPSDNIVFCRTRHVYDSYIDWVSLVQLSKFPLVYIDEIDLREEVTYILTPVNGEFRPHIDNQRDRERNAHIVVWNLERPSNDRGSVGEYARANRELLYNRYADEIWVSDRRLAAECHFRFVVLGSDEGLGSPGKEKSYQFCHMSYETNRRQTIYKSFDKKIIGPNCWPPQRDEVLKRSKFAVNIHQDQHPFQEPLRLALFAAYGLPVISESIYDAYPWNEDTMIFNPWDGMVPKIHQVLEDDYERWRQMGLKAREMMCHEFNFRKMVLQALEQTQGSWR